MKGYADYQRALRALKVMRDFCVKEGIPTKEWLESTRSRSYYVDPTFVGGSSHFTRNEVKEWRAKSRKVPKPLMDRWRERARDRFQSHLWNVRPSLRELGENCITVTSTPRREGFHTAGTGSGNRRSSCYTGRFFISPAWSLLEGWEEQLSDYLLLHHHRVAEDTFEVVTVKFLAHNETKLSHDVVARDPLTGVFYKSSTIEGALRARERERVKAIMGAL